MAIIPADEKVFMVDKRTNTTYGGSQALQDMQQWYTMQDVADSVQPYKVYTALLTQSGDDNPDSTYSGDLVIGRTYQIFDLGGADGYDFTNVGAPNNNIDTRFVATGTTPNSWGTNVALNYNSGAPVATVLENTIGNIWFTYQDSGLYYIVSSNLFPEDKTWYTTGIVIAQNANGLLAWRTTDYFRLFTFVDGDPANDVLSFTPIEIRVYN
jgi:hypothetical protein